MKAADSETTNAFSMPGIVEMQRAMFAVARMQAHAFKSMMRFQAETLHFMKHRAEQEMRLAESLVYSKDFADAFDIFARFSQDAVSEYSGESGKLAEITASVAKETARSVRRETQASIEDIAASTIA
jgi:hypothetical protein